MARRTPEEVLAQRDAWLERKARREAGEDLPYMPPLKPGETPPEAVEAAPAIEEAAPEPAAETPPAVASSTPEAAPAAEPAAAEAPARMQPQAPAARRSPEEVRAQREAYLAAKAARESGQAPPPAPTPAPAKPAPAAAPAAAPKAAPRSQPAAAKPAPARRDEPEPETIDPRITRRELLNYAWLASIGLLTVETVGLSLWFAFPNFKAGEFGGQFPIGSAAGALPEVNAGPVPYTDGKFWLVNVDTEDPDGQQRTGVLALFKVCTHLGCLYEWVPVTFRFECPCHGSKFSLTGDYLAGPARRSLDRFVIQAVGPDGTIRETDAEGNPLIVNADDTLIIDTGQRILGSSDIVPA